MTGFIYFLRCGEFIKIGWSAVPKVRARNLATACPYPISFIAAHPGCKEDEQRLHKYLKAHRHHREWFRDCPEIQEIIQFGIPHSDLPLRAVKAPRPPRPANPIRDMIKLAGGAVAIERASGGKIDRGAVYKWPVIGIPDRHWPVVINLGAATADQLLAANQAVRRAPPLAPADTDNKADATP